MAVAWRTIDDDAGVHQALAGGTRELFTIALAFGVLALVATLFLREVPLQRDDFFEDPVELVRESADGHDAQAQAQAQTRPQPRTAEETPA